MTNALDGLEPTSIWQHFEALCAIPRPSKQEGRAAAFVQSLAQSWGLTAIIDGVGNVIVKKPATPGMADRRTVVLQVHLDMVPQKTDDSTHNFATDPIAPRIDGGVVRANKTTLGADDGIGVACVLAVLQSKTIAHGPLETLFTIDEETGMTGANGLKPGLLTGDILLNLDSEDEGELCIGCAGGADVKARAVLKQSAPPATAVGFRVDVTGLKGGHSGVDIHLGRANATKGLVRLLDAAIAVGVDLRLATMQGGNLRNAIPRSAHAQVAVAKKDIAAFEAAVQQTAHALQAEYAVVDPDLHVEVARDERPALALNRAATRTVIAGLMACPHGVFAMVKDMPTVTETSNNLAIVTLAGGSLDMVCMERSSVDSRKIEVGRILTSVFQMMGADVQITGAYPGWQPNTQSPVLAMLSERYQQLFGMPAKVTATHGGLECGIIRSIYPQMDAVSIGPTIRFPHSPDEHVDIASVQRFWDFLVDALAHMPPRA